MRAKYHIFRRSSMGRRGNGSNEVVGGLEVMFGEGRYKERFRFHRRVKSRRRLIHINGSTDVRLRTSMGCVV